MSRSGPAAMRDSRLFSLLAIAGLLSLGLLAERNRDPEEGQRVKIRVGIELPEDQRLAWLGSGRMLGLRFHHLPDHEARLAGIVGLAGDELVVDLRPGTYRVDLYQETVVPGELLAPRALGSCALIVHADGSTEPAVLRFR